MEAGLGTLRFSPEEFWSFTLMEFVAAMDGYSARFTAKNTTEVTVSDVPSLDSIREIERKFTKPTDRVPKELLRGS